MRIDLFFQGRLPGEPLAWINWTTPGNPWFMRLGVVLVLDWRKRLPPGPSPFDGTCFAPKTPRGPLA
ncbi:hypothetical protein [Pseudaestuariivita sp.]|uniref:hypothetical protein n=1 Tax=Pseudaestuariivita sp. TaxID=2211669 RepID=UPI00405883F4